MPAGRPLTPITLTDDERSTLSTWSRRPTTAQRIALRAKIILAAAMVDPTSPSPSPPTCGSR
jgi:hypothetical protein